MPPEIELNLETLARHRRLRRPWPQKPRKHIVRHSRTDPYYSHIWRNAAMLLPLWEGGGLVSVEDISGNSHTGTLVNSPTWRNGILGPALKFNGTTQRFTVVDFTYGPTYTLLFWFKITLAENAGASTVLRHLWTHRHAASGSAGPISRIYVRGGTSGTNPGLLSFIIGDSDDASVNVSLSTSRVDDGQWKFLAITVFKGQGARLYLNGKFNQGTVWTAQNGDAFNPANNIFVGCSEPLTASEFFSGEIGFVGIVNRRISDQEIADLYMDPWGWLLPATGPIFGFRPGIPAGGAPPFLPEQLAFSAFGGIR
jgi:hypothetical protein